MTEQQTAHAQSLKCRQCEQTFGPGADMEITAQGAFCRPCYEQLALEVETLVRQQGQGINYTAAVIGGLAGAVVGTAVWWGFTVFTKIQFGLVAVVIGITVAKGILMATGGRRSREIQMISAGIAALAYFYADYLVKRTFILKQSPEYTRALTLLPDPAVFFNVTRMTFDLFTLIFLAITVYQAWKLVEPFDIRRK
ncbi:MAG: hypothetical protein GY697_26325 [Desulfobacterales bacterium]|nr:hypothetical protein [Desulfobacterales bacterium]